MRKIIPTISTVEEERVFVEKSDLLLPEYVWHDSRIVTIQLHRQLYRKLSVIVQKKIEELKGILDCLACTAAKWDLYMRTSELPR